MRPTRLLAVLAAALPLAASAYTEPTGIRNSAHDLSSTSTTPGAIKATTDNEICKFCHAPHKTQSTQLVWNHQLTGAAAYGWGNDLDGNALTKTTLGTTLASTIRGASKRCFSCHDGTVALGSVSNVGGGVAGTIAIPVAAGKVSATFTLAEAAYQVVATTMSGHHPVSIPYAGQTAYNGLTSAAVADGTVGNYYQTATGASCSGVAVCTAAPTSDGRNGTVINLIPNAVGGTTNVGIECVSCHEVHSKFGNNYFLRLPNTTSSGLCRSCHNK
jgi:predicted CXXCH cytochrome family protein